MPTRVLILGSGGREHALAWKLAAEPGVNEVMVAPGRAGMLGEARVSTLPRLDPLDGNAVVAVAQKLAAELVVVGPETPLAAGVADALVDAGFAVLGPSRAAARLETSKAFCHEVAGAAGVRMSRFGSFAPGDARSASAWIRTLYATGVGAVLKADGLAGGKGVVVTESLDQALDLAPSFLTGSTLGTPTLVVEERLMGSEASVIALCDGLRAVALPAARDHKRLLDDDHGPNTGGMGAYAPLPDLDDSTVEHILATVHRPILAEMVRRGTPFRGFLYAGLMLTDDGPVLLECNVRLGDPEAQVILPQVAGPIGPLLLAAAKGALPAAGPDRLPVLPGATVGIVLAAAGYPGTLRGGDRIDGLDEARVGGAIIFHAGTAARPGGGFQTDGGRVLVVVGRGPSLREARDVAERAADRISWRGMQRRRDIGEPGRVFSPVGVSG